ncbi:hypothetical protein Misp01_55840 [Microtetraspora sp. NBRC 13810]|nr:hypothetical protein Misp01_55840 [Microtetraspora sp. NBRC 13810]
MPIGKIQLGVAFGGIAKVIEPPCCGLPPLADPPPGAEPSPEEHPAARRVAATPSTASGRAALKRDGRGLFIGAPDARCLVCEVRLDVGGDDTSQL